MRGRLGPGDGVHDLDQVPAHGVGRPLGPLRVLGGLVAREHVDEALARGPAEERGRVGSGDVGVELVGVELGEDEPVFGMDGGEGVRVFVFFVFSR